MRKHNYVATLGVTNTIGIGIIEIGHSSYDYVKYQVVNGDKVSRIGTVRIRHDKNGNAYVIIHRNRYYMSQFTRATV